MALRRTFSEQTLSMGNGLRASLHVYFRPVIAIVLIGSTCLSSVQADWYSCRDADGKPLRGALPPNGCAGEICRNNSITGAQTCESASKTPEQRARREDAEQRQRECAKIARDQLSDDLRFLDKYWSDAIIEDEQNRALVEQQKRIDDAAKRLDDSNARVKKLQSDAEFYGPKHPMPVQLRGEIELNKKLLDAQELVTLSLANGMRQINEKYDSMKKRRSDLLARGGKPISCDSGMSQ